MAGDTGVTYSRPREGFRFKFGGMKTNTVPDSLPPDKYAYAQNVRTTRDTSLRTREGLTPSFPTSSGPVTDIKAYTALYTDNLPRFLAVRPSATSTFPTAIYLGQPANTSEFLGTLQGSHYSGAVMIPFRPAESPSPWMYIANGTDYQKFSAPAAGDVVTQQNVGIAEPQTAPDAAGTAAYLIPLPSNPGYVAGGVAGAVANASRITDTVQSVFNDPSGIAAAYPTLGVTSGQVYTRQMVLGIGGSGTKVEDVFPGQATPIGINAIYYFSGTTGHCVIVPQTVGTGPGNSDESIYTQNLLSTLRRGALIKFSGGPETCYVWSVVQGPDGTVCVETSTTATHTTSETFTAPAAIQVRDTGFTVSQAITSQTVTLSLSGAGIGTETSPGGITNPFVSTTFSFREDDYIQFPIQIGTLASLNELKLLFDVGDGSFTQNFYYYTARVSDIEASVQNTLTQLGAAQLVSQRATIDEENAAASHNQQQTASSAQTTPGDGQWAEIIFPISALTRVGNDQTKTLQNVGKWQVLFNVNAATTAAIGEISIFGGSAPDVGSNGAPYLYRVRPRSSVTGAKGNPSPETRYGVNPRRAPVSLSLPSAAYDAQIDTWDIFRYGGSVTSWRKIGQTAAANTAFSDIYGDDAAQQGEVLDFDNLQPWPAVDIPMLGTATTVAGFIAVVSVPNAASNLSIGNYLPGNLVRLGGINVYTLRVRPIQLTFGSPPTYLFQFVENAGAQTNVPCLIYEPDYAQYRLPYMWGPDSEGTIFAVGSETSAGTLYFSRNYDPDSAPSAYNQEIVAPTEPLMGGEILDGLSFVASTERWWALYPQPSNPTQRYSAVQQPLPRGLAAPYAHSSDGKSIFWWAKDGIWSSSTGSLTDADLSNLFPHDGVPGANFTYNGQTVFAPDYSRAITFRLTHVNNYLYAVYQDTTGTYRTLVLDMLHGGWSVDVYALSPVTSVYHPEQPEGKLLTVGTGYPLLMLGCLNGEVYQQTPLSNDSTTPIACSICTMEWDGGDNRAGMQWGDLWLDCVPNAGGSAVTATPMAFGAPVAGVTPTTVAASSSRVQTPVSVGGETLSDFLGMQIQWTDDFSQQAGATSLQIWQPSFIAKPETIEDRYTDWYDGGTEGAKFVQGFLLHADTFNTVKGLIVIDGDFLISHSFTPTVQHNGESIKAYSFNVPFTTHTMRIQPSDQLPWRFFDVDWIFEPTPESAETWTTQATSFGFNGYSHIQRIVAAYAATAPVNINIVAYDGTSPAGIVLPSTAGVYQKLLQVCTFNKGQLYVFSASSSAPFQFYLDDWEILVGNWGRQGPYTTWRSLGGKHGVEAAV